MANFENWLKKIEEAYLQNEYHFADLFQHLHQYPELSRKEEKTSSHLKNLIEENTGLKILRTVNHGFLTGYENTKRPSLCLRGDIDALPIEEKTGLPYASKVTAADQEGNQVAVMHACGHDMHMTVWAGTAKVMIDMKDQWKGTLMMIAQQAEERSGGAKIAIEAGLYEKLGNPTRRVS